MKENLIQFVNQKVQDAYNKLDDIKLKRNINKAFEEIRRNPFCGIQISKRLIPKEYIKKFNIHNVWKYNLPNAWRIIYSIEGGKTIIISIILEWMNHKEYERRFRY
ncbi:MAG: hypothetical protein WC260_02290 [Candidatus Pacearchaeota archaeon]